MKLPETHEIFYACSMSGLSEDQSWAIAYEVCQPFKEKIDQLKSIILTIITSVELPDDVRDAALDALNDDE